MRALLVLLAGCHHVEAQPIPSDEILSISLVGRDLPGHLRGALSQQIDARFEAHDAMRDRTALETALVDRGYLAAKVGDARVTYSARGVLVTYAVEPGAQFHIRRVDTRGLDVRVLTLAPGDVLDADRIDHVRRYFEERLGVPVTANVHPDVARAVADVELARQCESVPSSVTTPIVSCDPADWR